MAGLKGKLENAAAAQERGLTTRGRNDVLGWLQAPSTAGELAAALPKGQDERRWLRIIQTEVRRNPRLLEADYGSFALAVLGLAQLGLDPGPLGHAYLTGPFKNGKTGLLEVVPILGYKGLIDLAYRAGTVDLIDAVAVHEGEPFRVVRGSEQRLEHEELASCAQNKVVAYYAIAFPKGGGKPVFEVMWPQDIEAIRKRSRAKDDGPWKTDFDAMALKSPVRRMLNRGKVRLSPEVATAIAEDEAREFGYERPELLSNLPTLEPTKTNGKAAAEEVGGAKSKEQTPESPASSAPVQEAQGERSPVESPGAGDAIVADASVARAAPSARTPASPEPSEDPGAAFRGRP